MIAAHTLQDVVDAGLAPSTDFLKRRLRRGEIRGRKIGREWRMTDADIDAYLNHVGNTTPEPEPEPSRLRLTEASMRRRSA